MALEYESENLVWTPERDLETASAYVNKNEQPLWIAKRVINLVQQIDGVPLNQALQIVLMFVEAEKNTSLGNPEEPIWLNSFFMTD
ncbi:MAG: hypothetical protein ACHQUA_01795 [Microgenomates group bacterium]